MNLGAPDEMIKPTNKKAVSIFEQVAPDLKTNDNGEASYKVSQKNIWPPPTLIRQTYSSRKHHLGIIHH